MNRNDYQSGWDTDQFPNNVPEVALLIIIFLVQVALKLEVQILTQSSDANQ